MEMRNFNVWFKSARLNQRRCIKIEPTSEGDIRWDEQHTGFPEGIGLYGMPALVTGFVVCLFIGFTMIEKAR